ISFFILIQIAASGYGIEQCDFSVLLFLIFSSSYTIIYLILLFSLSNQIFATINISANNYFYYNLAQYFAVFFLIAFLFIKFLFTTLNGTVFIILLKVILWILICC